MTALLDVTDPATGEALCPAPSATAAEVDAAVRAADRAAGEWGALTPGERARALLDLAAGCPTQLASRR